MSTGAKIGIHNQLGNVQSWEKQFPCLKCLDPGDQNPAPGRTKIVRFYIEDAISNRWVEEGEAGADKFCNWILPLLAARPWIRGEGILVELLNEATPTTPEGWARPGRWSDIYCRSLNLFTVRAVARLHNAAYKVLGGNWGVGHPDFNGIAAKLLPVFRCIDAWGPHEYASAPSMQATYSRDPNVYLGRYKRIAAEVENCGVKIPPIHIGEFGLDLLLWTALHPESVRGGWRNVRDDPRWYANDIIWIMQNVYGDDPRVEGVYLYTSSPQTDWLGYEITEALADELLPYVRANWPKPAPVPAPIPVPIVPPPWSAIHDITASLEHHATEFYKKRQLSEIEFAVIHHSTGHSTVTPQAIARYHVRALGWAGIGYCFVIAADGTVFQTNAMNTVSYHAGTTEGNQHGVGICLIGDFSHQGPKVEQTNAAIGLCQRLGLRVCAHKELVETACPGDLRRAWWGRMVNEAGHV